MNLTAFTIQKLADFVCGGANGWPYRSGPDLVALFNSYGYRDVYGSGFPSRAAFARERLTELASKSAMEKLLCEIVNARNWIENHQDGLLTDRECLVKLNELLVFENYEVIRSGPFHKVQPITGSLVTVEAVPETLPKLTVTFIEEQIQKCRSKIEAGDYDGAITNARALLEQMLLAIEAELSTEAPPSFDGDLIKLFNRVRTMLNMDPSRKDISDSLKQVLSGLSSIVNGLASMRNKMSDSHAKSYKPERHHAKLAVNSAKTLADFLFETKSYQQQKGLLKPSST